MAMDAHDIEAMIKAALPDAIVEIKDLAGDGDHYAATVTSAAFKGKTRVQQHQMVYAALKGRMGNELHAMALQTEIPASAAPPRLVCSCMPSVMCRQIPKISQCMRLWTVVGPFSKRVSGSIEMRAPSQRPNMTRPPDAPKSTAKK
jgi:stress-induced morphogen